jgi:hypothetical protein
VQFVEKGHAKSCTDPNNSLKSQLTIDCKEQINTRTQNRTFHILSPKLNLQCVLPFWSNVCDLPHTEWGQSNVMLNQAIFIHSLQKPFQDPKAHERSEFHLNNPDNEAIKDSLQKNVKPQSSHQV